MLTSDVHVTKEEMLSYARSNGNEQAFNLVLLFGPDCFDSYDIYKELVDMLE